MDGLTRNDDLYQQLTQIIGHKQAVACPLGIIRRSVFGHKSPHRTFFGGRTQRPGTLFADESYLRQ